jgi:hypothetical protein
MQTGERGVGLKGPGRVRGAIVVAGILVLAVIAAPAIAADPNRAGGPLGGPPGQQGKPDKVKEPTELVTVTGTVSVTTDADGAAVYRVSASGSTWDLQAGPRWFHGDKHPLKAYVGKSVTITGETASGSAKINVHSVDGKMLREAGRPPWAGGWKHVGETHPGWSQDKADRFKARFGDCFPPGLCKKGDQAD